MTSFFRRRYTVTLYTSEPSLDLRDEIGEALLEIESESIVRGIGETQVEETKVSDEESERDFNAAEVVFASMSEEEFAASQQQDDASE